MPTPPDPKKKPSLEKQTLAEQPTVQFSESETQTVTGASSTAALPSDLAPEWRPGQTIEDLYRIERVLARGGMGVVFLATDLTASRPVVIKSMLPALSRRREYRKRFMRESETWVGLKPHPNIISAITVHEFDYLPRLVLEYVEGCSLLERMPSMDLRAKMDAAVQICRGMAHAHALGLIHRDLKPANVMVGVDGSVKVTDFGLVKFIGMPAEEVDAGGAVPDADADPLLTQGALGTPEYMAPEQWRENADAASDIYSFGALLYHLLAGAPPFETPGQTGIKRLRTLERAHREFEPKAPIALVAVPESLSSLVLRCLAKQQSDRPESFSALEAALTRIAGELSLALTPPVAAESMDIREELDRAYGRLRLARLSMRSGDTAKAGDLFELAEPVLMTHGTPFDKANLFLNRSGYQRNLGNMDTALSMLREGEHKVSQLQDDLLLGRYFNEFGSIYYAQSKLDDALAMFERAIRHYQKCGDKHQTAGAHSNIAIIQLTHGEYDRALDNLELAIAISRECGNLDAQCNAYNNKGLIHHFQHRHDEALEAYRISAEFAERIDLQSTRALLLNNIGLVEREKRNFDQAEIQFTAALKIARSIRDKKIESMAMINLATTIADLGDAERARECAGIAMTLKQELGDTSGIANALTILSQCKIYQRDLEGALEDLLEAYRCAATNKYPILLGEILFDLAELSALRGETGAAVEYAEKSLAQFAPINHSMLTHVQALLSRLKPNA